MASVDLKVNLPMSRIESIARRLGSQEVDVCPTEDHICWRHRGIAGYLPDTVELECANCHMYYILRGE